MYRSFEISNDGKLILELPKDFNNRPLEVYVIPREDNSINEVENEEVNEKAIMNVV